MREREQEQCLGTTVVRIKLLHCGNDSSLNACDRFAQGKSTRQSSSKLVINQIYVF